MRIRFLTSIASATWSFATGDEGIFPDEQAQAFIAGGLAEAAEHSEKPARVASNGPTAESSVEVPAAPSVETATDPAGDPATDPGTETATENTTTKKKGK